MTCLACVLTAACSGSSSPSAPTLVGGTTVIGFNTAADNHATFAIHRESGFVVQASSLGQWEVLRTYGRPAPFIQFIRSGAETTVGEIQVFANGAGFRFTTVDLYSSITPIPYVFEGYLRDRLVYTATGTVPNTLGNFATVRNPNAADVVTTLLIRLANPAVPGCVPANCPNPVGLDNIVVGNP